MNEPFRPSLATHHRITFATVRKTQMLVNTGPNWCHKQILTALERSPHRSAYADGALEFLKQETDEKVKHSFAKLVKWKNIKNELPPNFKLPPVAMVPHKSKISGSYWI